MRHSCRTSGWSAKVAIILAIAAVNAFLVAGYLMHLLSEKNSCIYTVLAFTVLLRHRPDRPGHLGDERFSARHGDPTETEMSLKAFHLIFVTLLTSLSFGCAAWAFSGEGSVLWGMAGVVTGVLVIVLRDLFFEETETHQLSVKSFLKILFALVALAPAKTFACAVCYGDGDIDSPMADGMNWGIFTLLAVIGTVLGAFLTFLIYVIRKSEALNAAAQKNSPEVSQTYD